ncbi:MAG: hypothetical protein J6D21_03990, partial [Clostridia bacterium]|nr:hypothetical protein [Clostridia bacterium]
WPVDKLLPLRATRSVLSFYVHRHNDLLIHHYRGPPSPLGKALLSASSVGSHDGCTSSFTLFSLGAEGPKKKAWQKRKAV